MKTKKYILLGVITCLFSLSSCNDSFLERPPVSDLTDENFWQTEQHVKSAANACYASLIGKDVVNYGELLGDNVMWYQLNAWRQIGSGLYGSDFGTLNTNWTAFYTKIRRCNYFLENYQRATEVSTTTLEKYAGEVKFLRAFNYFYLTSFWGDVPMVMRTIQTDEPEVYDPRAPRSEVVDYILQDLDDAAEVLPKSIAPATSNFGRISATAAIALKARIALQNERWNVAEQACLRLMPGGDLAYHELYSTGNPEKDYFDLFTFAGRGSRMPHNKETILAYVYNYDLAATARTYHNLSRELMVPDQIVRFNPTQAHIDSYLCNDGLPIEKSSKYKGNGTYTPAYSAYDSIFVDRDPRMKQSILYPGYNKWEGKEDGRGTGAINSKIFMSPKFNNDKKGATTLTGYYVLKYCEPTKVPTYNRDDNDIVILRYGDVLLMYAEAMFKQSKLTQSVVDQSINLLRDRVGMKRMVLTELTANGMDLEYELHRERRVEMFMEGMRWFDLIRWKEGYRLGVDQSESAEKQAIGIMRGLRKDNAYNQSQVSDSRFDEKGYMIFDDSRIFSNPKNYLFSLPYRQMELNPNLKPNNPGWD